VVETLRKALAWRQELDAGMVANQAEIARREGITRARVTQIMMLLRLAPVIQERILALPASAERQMLSERMLRPILAIDCQEQQFACFTALTHPSCSSESLLSSRVLNEEMLAPTQHHLSRSICSIRSAASAPSR